MSLDKGDKEKVPKDLSMKECYARIFEWHSKNSEKIFNRRKNSNGNDIYTTCYQELLKVLPLPEEVSQEDIVFICVEVLSGLMEWAFHEADSFGIKTAAYAEYILDSFFEGFHSDKTKNLKRQSKLFPQYEMSNCLSMLRK